MPIKVLEPQVVARIAAGEVVERPASVVKELVENALDASSTQVTVEVTSSGLGMMRVADNGVGIPSGEVELAFERHATSKISDLSDLDSLSSLGFRGEALASIAAVAQVEMVTCARGEGAGTCVRLVDGTVAERRRQGRSQGTTVTVRHLFRKVPARLKFLKSEATENSRIADVVIVHLSGLVGAKVTVTLEGEAEIPSGAPDHVVRTVTENSRTLKFTSQGFEKE